MGLRRQGYIGITIMLFKEQDNVLADMKDMIMKLRQDPSLEGQALAEFYEKWYLVKKNVFHMRNKTFTDAIVRLLEQ